jgi:hypothetical protein
MLHVQVRYMYRKINVGTRSLEESKRYYMSFILLQQIHLPGTTNIPSKKGTTFRKGVPYSVPSHSHLHTFHVSWPNTTAESQKLTDNFAIQSRLNKSMLPRARSNALSSVHLLLLTQFQKHLLVAHDLTTTPCQ